ncbi:hypothetical protein ACIBJF_21890 [Streptomyces sp. NPDC050743]|uniref:hypothetical protein n=1 Tax=Streptomyces sp. NPDC050743 TaxID=3365634 RepID=UPI00378EE6B3
MSEIIGITSSTLPTQRIADILAYPRVPTISVRKAACRVDHDERLVILAGGTAPSGDRHGGAARPPAQGGQRTWLREAEEVVHARGDRERRRQPDPLDVSSLAARAAAHPGRVAAIEAVWDGDTVHDLFVRPVAVLEEPDGEGHPATVHQRTDGPPPAAAATEAGQTLADRLGVPFHFASPDVPDHEAPRRRQVHRRGASDVP